MIVKLRVSDKGFKQLALRTNHFINLNQSDVRQGEIISRDRLTGIIDFKWIENEKERLNTPIIGYVSFFKLVNGFTSTYYMTVEEIEAHAMKYSKVYSKDKKGLWKNDRKGMSEKTVTKMNLSKNAPLSVENQAYKNLITAINADQSVIDDFGDGNNNFNYVDNDENYTPFEYVKKAKNAEDSAFDKIINKK